MNCALHVPLRFAVPEISVPKTAQTTHVFGARTVGASVIAAVAGVEEANHIVPCFPEPRENWASAVELVAYGFVLVAIYQVVAVDVDVLTLSIDETNVDVAAGD